MGEKGNPEQIINDGLAEAEPLLVSLCLRQKLDDGVTRPVTLDIVLSWPNRVIKPLFEKCKEISDLGEGPEGVEEMVKERDRLDKEIDETKKKEEERKNSQGISSDGSD